jgi:hypothetical protein
MTDNLNQRGNFLSEGPEPSAPVSSTGQPTPQLVASSPPPAYGRLDQTPNQQHVQNEMQGAPMPITAYSEPPHSPPHNYYVLVVITMIICSVLNPTSIGLGLPAMILSVLSSTAIQKNQWKKADKYGRIAFYLTVFNWFYTLFTTLVTFGTMYGYIMAAITTNNY